MDKKKRNVCCGLLTLFPAFLNLAGWLLFPVEGIPVSFPVSQSLIPVLLTVILWFCLKMEEQFGEKGSKNKKINGIVVWMIPVLSLFIFALSFGLSHGMVVSGMKITCWLLAAVFLVFGNYLPKCRWNLTVGIKLPWTFASEKNWDATHRMAGPVWMVAGLVILLGSFGSEKWAMGLLLGAILLAISIPAAFSYRLYRKQLSSGEQLTPIASTGKMGKYSVLMLVAVLVLSGILLFTGSVQVECGEDALHVEVSYYGGTTIPYSRIQSVQLRMENISGSREWGLGTMRLLAGQFSNQEFGNFSRYTYSNPGACIVLELDTGTVVLSGKDQPHTQQIYAQLMQRLEK